MIAVQWVSGHYTVAEDANDLLLLVGKMQWAPMDLVQIKRVLANRAFVWAGQVIDPHQDDLQFIRKLADAGMLRIVEEVGA